MEKEYKILKDSVLWDDRINSEDDCVERIEEYELKFPDSKFEYLEMSQEEIEAYYK